MSDHHPRLRVMRPGVPMKDELPRDGEYAGTQSGIECRFTAPTIHGIDKAALYIFDAREGLRGLNCKVKVTVKDGVPTSSFYD